jgi:hypothetical protein
MCKKEKFVGWLIVAVNQGIHLEGEKKTTETLATFQFKKASVKPFMFAIAQGVDFLTWQLMATVIGGGVIITAGVASGRARGFI